MEALAGVRVQVAETTAPRHATAIVRERLTAEAGMFDAVLTVGGDGTAMEVATALADFPDAPPLGIIAQGTANILARALGLPMNPTRAIRAMRDAHSVAIDMGQVKDGPAFAIGLGIGLDVAMIRGASPMLKRHIGWLAYGLSALVAGLRLERFHASITVDGVTHEVETSSVLVANIGSVLGGLLRFGDQIGHQDGVLDVCVYSPRTHLDALRILWRMLRGGVDADRHVRILRGRNIRVETDPPRPMQADGELLGYTPVEMCVTPKAVRVLVPHVAPRRWRVRRPSGARINTPLLEPRTSS